MSVIQGRAFFYEKTKKIQRMHGEEDIVFLSHEDIDELAASFLIQSGVKVVVNEKSSMTGRFQQEGVKRLLRANVHVFDMQEAVNARYFHGKKMCIQNKQLFFQAKPSLPIAQLVAYDEKKLHQLEKKAREVWLRTFLHFSKNSLQHAQRELSLVSHFWDSWKEGKELLGKNVLIVSRGNRYEEDVAIAFQLLLDKNVATIAVDGAADLCANFGCVPNYIVGDMDSVSDSMLRSGAKLIVHENEKGHAPGMKRMNALGLTAVKKRWVGVSEDVAIVHALKEGAAQIFIVGGQRGMEEYLGKGRKGMGSSLLVRMMAGSRLVDLKGIHTCFHELSPSFFRKRWIKEAHS